jgi:hypothetical protein
MIVKKNPELKSGRRRWITNCAAKRQGYKVVVSALMAAGLRVFHAFLKWLPKRR